MMEFIALYLIMSITHAARLGSEGLPTLVTIESRIQGEIGHSTFLVPNHPEKGAFLKYWKPKHEGQVANSVNRKQTFYIECDPSNECKCSMMTPDTDKKTTCTMGKMAESYENRRINGDCQIKVAFSLPFKSTGFESEEKKTTSDALECVVLPPAFVPRLMEPIHYLRNPKEDTVVTYVIPDTYGTYRITPNADHSPATKRNVGVYCRPSQESCRCSVVFFPEGSVESGSKPFACQGGDMILPRKDHLGNCHVELNWPVLFESGPKDKCNNFLIKQRSATGASAYLKKFRLGSISYYHVPTSTIFEEYQYNVEEPWTPWRQNKITCSEDCRCSINSMDEALVTYKEVCAGKSPSKQKTCDLAVAADPSKPGLLNCWYPVLPGTEVPS